MPYETSLHLLSMLESCRIPPAAGDAHQPYENAYLEAPPVRDTDGIVKGFVSWYFACVGLLGFVDPTDEVTLDKIGAFIRLYLTKIKPDGTIDDALVTATGDLITASPADADDSTAATFLSLVCAYARAANMHAWFASVQPLLEKIAKTNLIDTRRCNKALCLNIRRKHPQPVIYLEDNCEVYRGLRDFADYLQAQSLPHAQDWDSYARQSSRDILSTFFDRKANCWTATMDHTCTMDANDPTAFDPSGSGQLFPTAFDVGASLDQQEAGYSYLGAHFNDWPEKDYTLDSEGQPSGFPYLVLGYAAAKLGKSADTNALLRRAESLDDDDFRNKLTINELGWCNRIVQLP